MIRIAALCGLRRERHLSNADDDMARRVVGVVDGAGDSGHSSDKL